jgi:hypothetical protein
MIVKSVYNYQLWQTLLVQMIYILVRRVSMHPNAPSSGSVIKASRFETSVFFYNFQNSIQCMKQTTTYRTNSIIPDDGASGRTETRWTEI